MALDGCDVSWTASGAAVSHEFNLTLTDWKNWVHVENRLRAVGGEVSALAMTKRADRVYVRCRAAGISELEARQFASHLRAADLVENVAVEHLLLAERTCP
jgi:hypothetical protein